jgi:thiol:disulfide interchange protein DsbD
MLLAALLVALLGALAQPGAAGAQAPARHVAIELLAEKDTIAPGEEIWVALKEKIEPGWHTYWINPGDSGEPTTIRWQLPRGFAAGPIEWPIPEAIPVGPLTNYGYSSEVLLLARLKAPADAADGPAMVTAEAEWLVCADICVPESGTASLTLKVAKASAAAAGTRSALAIATARRKLPEPSPWPARLAVRADTIELTLVGAGATPAPAGSARPIPRFFPLAWGTIQNAAPQKAEWRGADLVLTLARGDEKGALDKLEGVLVLEEQAGSGTLRQGFAITAAAARAAAPAAGMAGTTVSPTDRPGTASGAGPAAARSPDGPIGLGRALLFALLGGLILNLMPCVFPVLSLKALAFARHGAGKEGDEAAHPAAHGLAYLGGVLASFAVLAAALLALRGMGQALGWGFQFQSPAFVLLLAGLFFALGLSLSGVISFGSGIAGIGDSLTRKAGMAGSFFTGALATIAATPCTAPFMGAAIGYAVAAPAIALVLVLMAMGLGLALPMLALSASPGLRRLLPRPGAWMETLKQALAFPLYATAAWLVWVLSLQQGSDGVLAAMVLATGIGFCAWLLARTAQGPALLRALPALLLLLVGAASLRLLAAAPEADRPAPQAAMEGSGPPALAFSESRLAELRAGGAPVLVNMTAAWCITCNVNERVALSSDRIRAAFAEHGVTYLKGDWTRQDPAITAYLESFGRAGVPLYVLYPAGGGEPRLLPQLLTETAVLEEIRSAGRPDGKSSDKTATTGKGTLR